MAGEIISVIVGLTIMFWLTKSLNALVVIGAIAFFLFKRPS